ncbi:MAG: hypothetical protein C4563_06390 [Desulfobulbus sp.]|jgi:hypothetical protein|nr:MAG: hypothetical protein C4563_06390 [Desulfobulbus sp.]
MAIGQRINMFSAGRRLLEQQYECRGLGRQFEQLSDELEQQRGRSARLRFPSKRKLRIVEPQGCVVLHNGEILPDRFLVGRCPKTSETFA